MPRMDRLSTYRTTWAFDDEGKLAVTYASTVIVRTKGDGSIVLNSGGYETVTTKRKMNQAASQFGMKYGVFQRDWTWYVEWGGKAYNFQDGMVLIDNDGDKYVNTSCGLAIEPTQNPVVTREMQELAEFRARIAA